MTEPMPHAKSKLPVIHLLPNLVTIGAVCAGLTAMRMGHQGNFEGAVGLILLACVLDGLDGRLARLLHSESLIGAELDSLADFLNFGVVPAIVLYMWALEGLPILGWTAVLVYAICCVLRLARFNVGIKSEKVEGPSEHFVGVPSPAGAFLAMVPMFASFLLGGEPVVSDAFLACYMIGVALLMISTLPTPSFKNLSISRSNAKYFLIVFVVLLSGLLTQLWFTLAVLGIAYLCLIFWAFVKFLRKRGKSA